ncbi:MAG: ATP synthase F1 subunit gamma [Spirochaetaceae bacterium]|nr:ATP synthase F1 subunit gamma [Spirochaetaceae bacterium]
MANLRDIRLRMRAIGQTLQVTKAMKLISTSKLRKGRILLEDTEPYFNRIQQTMSDLLRDSGNVDSEYLKKNRDGRTAVIVVTSDKGLAGGYNANIFRYVMNMCQSLSNPILIIIGTVGQRYFLNSPYLVLENFTFSSRVPTVADAQDLSEYVVSQFDWGVFAEVRIVYTHMYNAMRLLPAEREVLPLDEEKITAAALPEAGEPAARQQHFEYEPSAEAVFDTLAPLYIKGVIYGCLVEAYASEQSARMSAMDEASKNADEMLASKTLFYNRIRQAGITQEVTEIVSGSAALTS